MRIETMSSVDHEGKDEVLIRVMSDTILTWPMVLEKLGGWECIGLPNAELVWHDVVPPQEHEHNYMFEEFWIVGSAT